MKVIGLSAELRVARRDEGYVVVTTDFAHGATAVADELVCAFGWPVEEVKVLEGNAGAEIVIGSADMTEDEMAERLVELAGRRFIGNVKVR